MYGGPLSVSTEKNCVVMLVQQRIWTRMLETEKFCYCTKCQKGLYRILSQHFSSELGDESVLTQGIKTSATKCRLPLDIAVSALCISTLKNSLILIALLPFYTGWWMNSLQTLSCCLTVKPSLFWTHFILKASLNPPSACWACHSFIRALWAVIFGVSVAVLCVIETGIRVPILAVSCGTDTGVRLLERKIVTLQY
jgi:hypothetical protein